MQLCMAYLLFILEEEGGESHRKCYRRHSFHIGKFAKILFPLTMKYLIS